VTINENLRTLDGRPVIDWGPGDSVPDPASVAVRLRTVWDDEASATSAMLPLLESLAEAIGPNLQALVIGAWGRSYDNDSAPIVGWLAGHADRLPALRALFLGDLTFEESEISWIEQSDITPILGAFPDLEVLGVRGGTGLRLEPVTHARLRHLTIESGGLPGHVVRAIAASSLPALRHLELWLGDPFYGADTTIEDLQPILDGRFALTTLAIRNAEDQDGIARAVAGAPVLDGLDTLDLSLGSLSDVGGEALLASVGVRSLRRLDLHHHYLSEAMTDRLTALPVELDVRDRLEPDVFKDEVLRPVAVSE
jgi:hypothetical protein